jgi:NADH pyrophosphatase NudC (nudix superfamily)
MLGCIAEAASTAITVDPDVRALPAHTGVLLDVCWPARAQELADARWFARDEVAEFLRRSADLRAPGIRLPPKYALSHQLIRAWLESTAAKY